MPNVLGLALVLAALPALVWGAMNYAQGKGKSPSLGLLGLAVGLGLIALIFLPPKEQEMCARQER